MNENGYDNNQQYNNGYDQQYGGQQVNLPEGVMEHLPEWMKDKVEDVMAMAEQEKQNRARYGNVEPYKYRSNRHPLVTVAAIAIGFGGAFFFVFVRPNYMLALICFGIMLLIYGIGYLTDKNYCFRKEPTYTAIPVLGVIFILVAAYHLLAKNIPTLPQPGSIGLEGWVCGLFTILGVVMLILDCISFYCMKKVCTEPVSAVCVYVKKKVVRSNKSSTTKYSGVFEYQFRGNTYWAAEAYRDSGAPHVGVGYDLCINPSVPTDFYRKSWKLMISSLIGYIFFIVFPIVIYNFL